MALHTLRGTWPHLFFELRSGWFLLRILRTLVSSLFCLQLYCLLTWFRVYLVSMGDLVLPSVSGFLALGWPLYGTCSRTPVIETGKSLYSQVTPECRVVPRFFCEVPPGGTKTQQEASQYVPSDTAEYLAIQRCLKPQNVKPGIAASSPGTRNWQTPGWVVTYLQKKTQGQNWEPRLIWDFLTWIGLAQKQVYLYLILVQFPQGKS